VLAPVPHVLSNSAFSRASLCAARTVQPRRTSAPVHINSAPILTRRLFPFCLWFAINNIVFLDACAGYRVLNPKASTAYSNEPYVVELQRLPEIARDRQFRQFFTFV